jgi:hypothetical protein
MPVHSKIRVIEQISGTPTHMWRCQLFLYDSDDGYPPPSTRPPLASSPERPIRIEDDGHADISFTFRNVPGGALNKRYWVTVDMLRNGRRLRSTRSLLLKGTA